MDVFTVCPEYETEHFKIRKLDAGDVEGLFPCYSDPEAARYLWNKWTVLASDNL